MERRGTEWIAGVRKKRFLPPWMAKGKRLQESGQRFDGQILQLVRGQGHGFIRTKDGQKLFFHRYDVEGTGFNDLIIGDVVTGEAIADRLSGPRAVKVRKL